MGFSWLTPTQKHTKPQADFADLDDPPTPPKASCQVVRVKVAGKLTCEVRFL